MNLQRRQCLSGLGLLAAGWALNPGLALAGVRRDARLLMGTRVDLVLGEPHADAPLAIDAAWAEMQRLERLMSRYRSESLVSALHRQAGRGAVQAPPELLAVLRQAAALSERTRGDFDISVGAYQGWSFDATQPHRPSAQELQEERRLVNHRDVLVDGNTVRLARPGMRIDLGGVAKLPILQAGMRVLERHGVRHAMINGGGDVLTRGQLHGQDWRVGLRDPRAPGQLLGVLTMRDGCVASSGDYERTFLQDGRRYHHVLDPRTGWPTEGVRGVVLVARDTAMVNGIGAAAMVGGPARGLGLMASLPGVDSLLVDAGGAVHTQGRMAQRLQAA